MRKGCTLGVGDYPCKDTESGDGIPSSEKSNYTRVAGTYNECMNDHNMKKACRASSQILKDFKCQNKEFILF